MADITNKQKDLDLLKGINEDKTPGGVMTQEVIDRILQGKVGQNSQSLYQQMLAEAATPTPPINAIAQAAGSGASSPQTMALVNNPTASGVNNVLRFAKGFSDNVNAAMAKPTYKDMIEAQKLDIERQKAGGAGGDMQKSANDDLLKNINTIALPETINYYNKAAEAYKAATALASTGTKETGTLDSTVLMAYIKTQNPNIRVAAGEPMDTSNMKGFTKQLGDKYNAMLAGKAAFSGQDERNQFMSAIDGHLKSQKAQYDNFVTGITKGYGVAPSIDYWGALANQGTTSGVDPLKQEVMDAYNNGTAEDKAALKAAYPEYFR
jgi:hypothetical protein